MLNRTSQLYPNLLKIFAIALFLFNAGVVGYLFYLDALDRKESRKIEQEQNIYRARFLISTYLDRLHYCATAWGQGLAPVSKIPVELLMTWQRDELNCFDKLLDETPVERKYAEDVRKASDAVFAGTEVPEQLRSAAGRARLNADYNNKHYNIYAKSKLVLWGPVYKESEEYLLKKAPLQVATIVNHAQTALLLAFVVNISTMLLLALLPLVNGRLMASFRDNTSLFQKFAIMVALPLLSQLSIYAILGGFTLHASKQLKQIAEADAVEELCAITHRQLSHLILDGDDKDKTAQKRVLAGFHEQKRRNQPDNPFLARYYGDLISSLPETMALRPQLSAEKLWIDKTRNMYGDEKFRESCERLMSLQRMGYPSISKEGLINTRREALVAQVERIQQVMNLSLLACALQMIMSVLTLRLFGNSIAQRFGSVITNMERYARSEDLGAPLDGQDEAAQLEAFLSKTAATIKDLSRKEKQMIDSASDAIFSVSGGLRIDFVNDAVLMNWGYRDGELLGSSINEVLRGSDNAENDLWLQAQKLGSATKELKLEHDDDGARDLMVAAQWSPESQQFFCVAQDITAQKQVDRLKRDFLAMVSHDLRTPLTASNLFLELLGAGVFGELSEGGTKTLELTMRKSMDLIALIKDLLDIEKLEGDSTGGEKCVVELSDLKPEILSMINDALKAKSLSAKIECPEDLFVKVDEDRLLQAFVNVLLAIIGRTKPNSTITITMSQQQTFAEIEIGWCNDFNVSVLSEDSFELYRSRVTDDTAIGAASRLGLPLVRTILRNQKGDVFVKNTSTERTTCTVRLPLLMAYMTNSELHA